MAYRKRISQVLASFGYTNKKVQMFKQYEDE